MDTEKQIEALRRRLVAVAAWDHAVRGTTAWIFLLGATMLACRLLHYRLAPAFVTSLPLVPILLAVAAVLDPVLRYYFRNGTLSWNCIRRPTCG